jgi:hypothetical protein
MAQGVGPEFKTQYRKKKKKSNALYTSLFSVGETGICAGEKTKGGIRLQIVKFFTPPSSRFTAFSQLHSQVPLRTPPLLSRALFLLYPSTVPILQTPRP